ncbi:MAG: hypothetical protein Q9214_007100 [Letrouitia sp. 1 TL-2023]
MRNRSFTVTAITVCVACGWIVQAAPTLASLADALSPTNGLLDVPVVKPSATPDLVAPNASSDGAAGLDPDLLSLFESTGLNITSATLNNDFLPHNIHIPSTPLNPTIELKLLIMRRVSLDPTGARLTLHGMQALIRREAQKCHPLAYLSPADDPLVSNRRMYPTVSFSIHSQQFGSTSRQRLRYVVVDKVLEALTRFVVMERNNYFMAMAVDEERLPVGKGMLEPEHGVSSAGEEGMVRFPWEIAAAR